MPGTLQGIAETGEFKPLLFIKFPFQKNDTNKTSISKSIGSISGSEHSMEKNKGR